MGNTRAAGQLNARRIDPVTKDYAFESHDRIAGMTTGQQNVYLGVQTDLGTSAVLGLGQELRSIKTITASFARRVDSTLRQALSGPVLRGEILILTVSTTRIGKTGAFARVRWRDLSTGEEKETDVG